MATSRILVAVAAVTLVIGVSPVHAGQRGAGGPGRGWAGGRPSAAPRVAVPRSVVAPRVVDGRTFRGGPSPSVVASREAGWRSVTPGVYGTRGPVVVAAAQSHGYYGGPRGGVAVGRAVPRVVVAPHGAWAAPVRFYRPYYTFRPRLHLGIGLWVGFPIAYPFYYGYYNPFFYPRPYPVPYPYPYPYVYPPYGYPYPAAAYPAYPPPPAYPPSAYPPSAYPPSAYPPPSPPAAYPPAGSVGVQPPNQINTGGVSFEITPGTAEVFVDGQYVGTVGQFTPTSQALGLTPGRHHIEIRAPGYRTIDFDVDIIAGQVIPYQGALER